MCQYRIFTFLCGGQRLTITSRCEHFATNYQGLEFCRLDPQAHVNDGKPRQYTTGFGPGICCNMNCRDAYGMLPYELSTKKNACDSIEDDSEFDMSPDACLERELRWYRLLTTDQQLECLNTTFPVPIDSMTEYARTYLYLNHLPANEWAAHFESAWDANPDEVTWQELNPRYMSQCALQSAMALHLLPAWVVDTKQPVPDPSARRKKKSSSKKQTPDVARTTTPLMPLYGPFKIQTHTCSPRVGFCKTCGHYHGKQHRRKPFVFHQADYAAGKQMLKMEDPEVVKGMQEAVWGTLTHERKPVLGLFHGNDFERRVATELCGEQQLGGTQEGAALAGGEAVENTDMVMHVSSDDQQQQFPLNNVGPEPIDYFNDDVQANGLIQPDLNEPFGHQDFFFDQRQPQDLSLANFDFDALLPSNQTETANKQIDLDALFPGLQGSYMGDYDFGIGESNVAGEYMDLMMVDS